MPRIRSIHPSQWTDENFVECSFAARLLIIAVRNETDDNGIFEWKPRTLKMKLFPADNIDLEPLLEELIVHTQIMKFQVNGVDYGIIRNFQRFQRPEKPKFIYPVPEISAKGYILNPKYSANTPPNSNPQSPMSRRPIADQSPKVVSEGTGTVTGTEKGKEQPTKSTDIKNLLTSPVSAKKEGGGEVFFNNFIGGFDVRQKISDTALEKLNKFYGGKLGWDMQNLINIYNKWINESEIPANAEAGFKGWCKKFTKDHHAK